MLVHIGTMTSSNGNISALLAVCEGNSPISGKSPVNSPHKGQWRWPFYLIRVCNISSDVLCLLGIVVQCIKNSRFWIHPQSHPWGTAKQLHLAIDRYRLHIDTISYGTVNINVDSKLFSTVVYFISIYVKHRVENISSLCDSCFISRFREVETTR